MAEEKTGIKEHAHRGKKQQTKEVAKRHNVTESLMAVIRLAEHHAGNKGAEGKG